LELSGSFWIGEGEMPIYEYECSECGAHFERWQRLNDPQPSTCPNGHAQVRRMLSQPAIIFKGSGFYATDHGRNGMRSTSRKAEKKPGEEKASAAPAEPASKESDE
jgi:putative FmdB family regulatory protein